MKKTLGYFYKLSKESLKETLEIYGITLANLSKDRKALNRGIESDKKQNFIGRRTRPKQYRIVVEEVDTEAEVFRVKFLKNGKVLGTAASVTEAGTYYVIDHLQLTEGVNLVDLVSSDMLLLDYSTYKVLCTVTVRNVSQSGVDTHVSVDEVLNE